MEEEAKINLYKQLMKFRILAKAEEESLKDWNEFSMLSDADVFKYTIAYRDECLEQINKKKPSEETINEFYIELPNMDLSGKNLEDTYLHMFTAGLRKERHNGKKIFVTSNVNLKNTKCVINLATIKPTVVSEDRI